MAHIAVRFIFYFNIKEVEKERRILSQYSYVQLLQICIVSEEVLEEVRQSNG